MGNLAFVIHDWPPHSCVLVPAVGEPFKVLIDALCFVSAMAAFLLAPVELYTFADTKEGSFHAFGYVDRCIYHHSLMI